MKILFFVHVFVSGGRQLCSLFYPVRQLHYVCRVDAEEDVQDFLQLLPGLDSPQVVVLFLCAERALHRCRPHPGKFLSDKVFSLLLLAERPSSLHERCLYPILLTVVSVVGSGLILLLACPKSDELCHFMERKQPLNPTQFTLFQTLTYRGHKNRTLRIRYLVLFRQNISFVICRILLRFIQIQHSTACWRNSFFYIKIQKSTH